MRPLAALLLVTIGCGGAGADPLVGTWATMTNASCGVGFEFAADDSYEIDLACVLADGSDGLQTEIGTFTRSSDRLTFSVERTTCAGTPTPYYLNYSLDPGPRLRLTASNAVEVLTPFVPTGGGAAPLGCFASGAFAAAPLAPP